MNILIVGDYFLAEMGYPRISLAQAWQKAGHVVHVITSNRYFPFHDYEQTVEKLIGPRQRTSGAFEEKGIHVERRPVIFEFFARAFFGGIQQKVALCKPDRVIVFGVSSCSAIQVSVLKWLGRISCPVVMVDSMLPSELMLGNQALKSIFYSFFRLFFSNLISSQTDVFVATQDKTIDIIRSTYGISKEIKLIPNGTDTELFTRDTKMGNEIRKAISIPTNAFTIVYTGKVIPEKGIDILCKAFNQLSKKHTDIHVLLVGGYSEEYKKQCQSFLDRDVANRIHWVGVKQREELPRYYSAADVAVWPLQESLAMNDAASCELPIIANDTMGDTTRVSNHNAFLYTKGDHFDLANKLEILYSDPTLRKKMGKRGRQLVLTKLSWGLLAQHYLS